MGGKIRIPEGIERDILLRLPLKSILRFKAVSKSWNIIITEKAFASQHLTLAQGERFLGLSDYCCPCAMFKEDFDGNIQSKNFDFPVLNTGFRKCFPPSVRNCCNGLICFRVASPNQIVLWNPTFQRDVKAFNASCDPHNCNSAVGFDPITEDYKVVCFHGGSLKLCSLKEDEWRTVAVAKTASFSVVGMEVVYNKGCLHYIGGMPPTDVLNLEKAVDKPCLVSLDMGEETIECLKLPPSCNRVVVPLKYKGSIGVSFRNAEGVNEIWVLNESAGSWFNIFKHSCFSMLPYQFCFKRNGDMLLFNRDGIFEVDPNDASLKKVDVEANIVKQRQYNRFSTFAWVDSLVSPESLLRVKSKCSTKRLRVWKKAVIV